MLSLKRLTHELEFIDGIYDGGENKFAHLRLDVHKILPCSLEVVDGERSFGVNDQQLIGRNKALK